MECAILFPLPVCKAKQDGNRASQLRFSPALEGGRGREGQDKPEDYNNVFPESLGCSGGAPGRLLPLREVHGLDAKGRGTCCWRSRAHTELCRGISVETDLNRGQTPTPASAM